MVTAKLSLAKLIFVTFGVVASTGMLARAAPVETTTAPATVALNPTDIIEIIKCQIGCFGQQVASSETPNVIAMYNSCQEQCGSEDNMQTLTCKVAACQHLVAAYTPPSVEGDAHNQFNMCVETSCPFTA
ncbi:hypothetical protein CPB97_011767 [Podila verticillata]|nr:hypothetical protein CPB97_011767 [Podila verticillata]